MYNESITSKHCFNNFIALLLAFGKEKGFNLAFFPLLVELDLINLSSFDERRFDLKRHERNRTFL